jgi:hypothetical protein
MSATVNNVVNEHVRASRRFRKAVKGDAARARAFLVRAGILDKSGTRLAKRYR